MTVDSYAGTWTFDPGVSDLKPAPTEWQQVIRIEGNSVSVREEIHREGNRSIVEVTGAFDGNFHRVEGSPLVDEIAYNFEFGHIKGIGRRQRVVVLREVVSLPKSDTLNLALTLVMQGKEVPLGNAAFRRTGP